MEIVVIGGTGTIGSAVVERLSQDHDVTAVGHTSGEKQVDITSTESIRALFEELHMVDAVVSCTGDAVFGELMELTDADFETGLRSKLMGQVNLVRYGIASLRDGGSFTLTTGVLAQEPMVGGATFSLVNAGVEGFARSAALELPRDLRLNVVSPPWISETLEEMGKDPEDGMWAAEVAEAYVASIEGEMSGEILDARDYHP